MPDCVYFCGDIKPDLALSLLLEKEGVKISHSRVGGENSLATEQNLSLQESVPF
jgi:hypothetical protein